MSCNPAIGGLAKGHLVKEIDALGGEMAKATDETGIQFRQLNTTRGPAVRSSRAQVDRQAYRLWMKKDVEDQKNLFLKQATVEDILVDGNKVTGVRTHQNETILTRTLILARDFSQWPSPHRSDSFPFWPYGRSSVYRSIRIPQAVGVSNGKA